MFDESRGEGCVPTVDGPWAGVLHGPSNRLEVRNERPEARVAVCGHACRCQAMRREDLLRLIAGEELDELRRPLLMAGFRHDGKALATKDADWQRVNPDPALPHTGVVTLLQLPELHGPVAMYRGPGSPMNADRLVASLSAGKTRRVTMAARKGSSARCQWPRS